MDILTCKIDLFTIEKYKNIDEIYNMYWEDLKELYEDTNSFGVNSLIVGWKYEKIFRSTMNKHS
jgi:hypothetical protein